MQKRDKCSASLAFYFFSSTFLINSLKPEHSCKILYLSFVIVTFIVNFFSSPESSWVRPSVGPHFQNMNISETSWRIIIKFHLEHHWVGGLAAIGLRPDWIRTLVSMTTDSSHRVIMGKSCDHSSSFIVDWFFILAGNDNNHNTFVSRMCWKFGKIQPGTYELAALERLGKSP